MFTAKFVIAKSFVTKTEGEEFVDVLTKGLPKFFDVNVVDNWHKPHDDGVGFIYAVYCKAPYIKMIRLMQRAKLKALAFSNGMFALTSR